VCDERRSCAESSVESRTFELFDFRLDEAVATRFFLPPRRWASSRRQPLALVLNGREEKERKGCESEVAKRTTTKGQRGRKKDRVR
jgi:hypothetical protein